MYSYLKFGGIVQTLLTKTDYTELSDSNLIETDALHLTNKLYSQFLFEPQVMKRISSNKNGESIPDEIIERIIQGSLLNDK